jgi:hypothetical protein
MQPYQKQLKVFHIKNYFTIVCCNILSEDTVPSLQLVVNWYKQTFSADTNMVCMTSSKAQLHVSIPIEPVSIFRAP